VNPRSSASKSRNRPRNARKTPRPPEALGNTRHARPLAGIVLALAGISGCASNTTSSDAPKPPATTFSPDLNAFSVFVGASIIQYWPLPIHNAGVAGETTAKVLARFKATTTGHGYSRVILLCGTNDILANTPDLVTELTANLSAMEKIARDAGLEVVLSELPPIDFGTTDLTPQVIAVNASIMQLAIQRGDLVVDFYTPCSATRSSSPTASTPPPQATPSWKKPYPPSSSNDNPGQRPRA